MNTGRSNGITRRSARNLTAPGNFNRQAILNGLLWKFDDHYNNWRKQEIPCWMKQIALLYNQVLVIGSLIVYNDSDLITACNLSKQLKLTTLT
jgi:hypothetical protein